MIWLLMIAPGCGTLSSQRATTTRLIPHQPQLKAKLWHSSPQLKAALQLCHRQNADLQLDGGGPLTITKNGIKFPPLSLDWIYNNNQMIMEAANPTGANVFNLTANPEHAQFSLEGHTSELTIIHHHHQPQWRYNGLDLLINHQDLSCLLGFGIPAAWHNTQGHWRFYPNAQRFHGKYAGHHLELIHRTDRQRLCIELHRTKKFALIHTKYLRICYDTHRHLPTASPPDSQNLTVWIQLNKQKWQLHWQSLLPN